MYESLKPGPGESKSAENEPVCGDEVSGGHQVYIRDPLTPSGIGLEALERLQENGAKLVKDAMVKEYGREVAEAALGKVSQKTNRNLGREVTYGDLTLLNQNVRKRETKRLRDELGKRYGDDLSKIVLVNESEKWSENLESELTRGGLKFFHREMTKQRRECRTLNARIPRDAPEKIRDQASQVWQATPGGTDGFQWIDGVTEVQLRGIVADCILERSMTFDPVWETLKLKNNPGKREDNMIALAQFIASHFEGVGPKQPEFGNIANNMFSYLHPGVPRSMTERMKIVAEGAAEQAGAADDDDSWLRLRKSHGNICVTQEISVRYANVDGAAGDVDFLKYRFVRSEEVRISPTQLRRDPREFDARTDLAWAGRVETIHFTRAADYPMPADFSVPINLT
jgi:hypothetical protein